MRSIRCLAFVAAVAALTLGSASAAAGGGRALSPSGKAGGHAENRSARVSHLGHATVSGVECPPGLKCQFLPAAYAQNSSDPGDYGNYDLADRPADGLAIRYVVVHDTEVLYDPTLAEFQNSHAYVSSHYVIRSRDGFVTQMVPTKDVAWHAGNWYVNTHSVGIENEGFALDLSDWFTPRLYHSLARLTRYQAQRFGFPLDRAHVVGHDQVPGPTGAFQAGMHWDPGPFFDWAHFMALVGAPITPQGDAGTDPIVTIDPNWKTNRPLVTGCGDGTQACPTQPASFVYLHTAPSADSPLVSDPYLAAAGVEPDGVGTTRAWDWGDKASTGTQYAVAGRSGNWLAIWFGGEKAWLYSPHGEHAATIPGRGTLITPKAGLASTPVYGRAYPSSISTATLDRYSIPAGQAYVAKDLVTADYYSASTFNAPDTYHLYTSPEQFYEIFYNHRIAYVRAEDVDVVG
ncbi:MAG: N-acetylmuramoyl-L-alanine amidase [Gaiellaceae bacterium]